MTKKFTIRVSKLLTAHLGESDGEQRPVDFVPLHAALRSAESLAGLRAAFPNYYMDATAVVDALQLAIQE